ncbi:MAG: DNA translocase FtsK 4TM domain-containing protein, partial [Mesorhizobium sp.]
MRSSLSTSSVLLETGSGLAAFARRQAERVGGLVMIAATIAAVGALATWSVSDPSFSHATDNPVTNALGYAGAVYSDIATQFFGLAALMTLLPLLAWGVLFSFGRAPDRLPRRGVAWLFSSILLAGVIGCIQPSAGWPLPTGLGGVLGDVVLKLPSLALGGYPTGIAALLIGMVLAAPALYMLGFASGVFDADWSRKPAAGKAARDEFEGFDDEEDDTGSGAAAIGAVVHWWLSTRAFFKRHGLIGREKAEPAMRQPSAAVIATRRIEPGFDTVDDGAMPYAELRDDMDDFAEQDFNDPAQYETFENEGDFDAAPQPV